MVFSFRGNRYKDIYKAGAKAYNKQIHLAFLTDDFRSWYADRAAGGDVTIADLENRNIISSDQLSTAKLIANVWGCQQR